MKAQPIIGLKEVQKPYTLTIKKQAQDKIDLICRKIHNDEWSGVLFYEVDGSFAENNVHVIVQDIFVMDIGTAAYTEYVESPDIIHYMAVNDLLDCYMGLIHSHNNMSTFFSGTDTATLKEEAVCRNHFVSLIVNNYRAYTAGITTVLKTKTKHAETFEYVTFDGSLIVDGEATESETEKSEIIWSKLKINIESDTYVDEELSARLDELAKLKAAKPVYNYNHNQYKPKVYTPPVSKGTEDAKVINFTEAAKRFDAEQYKQDAAKKTTNEAVIKENLLEGNVGEIPAEGEESGIDYNLVSLSDETALLFAKKLVMGSILVPLNNKVELANFIPQMESMYDKIFKDNLEYQGFIGAFVEFLLFSIDDANLNGFDQDEVAAIGAFSIICILEEFPTNPYLNTIIKELSGYVY